MSAPDPAAQAAEASDERRPGDLGSALALFLSALALRLGYLLELRGTVWLEVLIGDGAEYDRWARSLLAGGDAPAVFYQAPLYPYLLAGLYAVVGPSPLAVFVLQAVAGAGACVLLALAGRRFFSPRVGWIAGALLALYPYAIFYVGLVQKTTLALFFLCALLWLLGAARLTPRPPRLLGVGLGLGALILLRENALVLLPVLALWPLLEWRSAPWRVRLARSALVVAGAGLLLGPVAWRNAAHGGGGFLPTTFQLGPNLYAGNHRGSTGRYAPLREGGGFPGREQGDAWQLAEAAVGAELSAAGVSDYWVARTFEEIAADPAAWLGLVVRKAVLLWNAEEVLDIEAPEVYADESLLLAGLVAVFHFGVLFPLALWGLCATAGAYRRLALLYGILATTAASVIVFFVLGRLRFTLVPVLLLFAAAGLAAFPGLRRASPRRRALCAGALVLGAVFANWPLPGGVTDARAHTYNDMGVALREEGREEEARRYFEHSLARDPTFTRPLLNLASGLRAEGRIAEALGFARRALALDPDSPVVRLHLGAALVDGRRLAEADTQLGRARALDPGLPGLDATVGVLRLAQGRPAEAVAPLRRAAARRPEDPDARNNLGVALGRSGRIAEARAAFREALRLDPAHVSARENLRAFGG